MEKYIVYILFWAREGNLVSAFIPIRELVKHTQHTVYTQWGEAHTNPGAVSCLHQQWRSGSSEGLGALLKGTSAAACWSGLEPATLRLQVQSANQWATAAPISFEGTINTLLYKLYTDYFTLYQSVIPSVLSHEKI